jgi:hypothetical protein
MESHFRGNAIFFRNYFRLPLFFSLISTFIFFIFSNAPAPLFICPSLLIFLRFSQILSPYSISELNYNPAAVVGMHLEMCYIDLWWFRRGNILNTILHCHIRAKELAPFKCVRLNRVLTEVNY